MRSVVACGPRQYDTITHGGITIDGGGQCINIAIGCKRLCISRMFSKKNWTDLVIILSSDEQIIIMEIIDKRDIALCANC